MVTYNHEKYIKQAIESALAQKTNFDYELVIGEDCSPDGTRKIISEFQRRYPKQIRIISQPVNIGLYLNLINTLRSCQGRYIAGLEGDDYWTSPNKLQKQVDYLDKHPECSLCLHKASIERDGSITEHKRAQIQGKDKQYSFNDIVTNNFIDSATVVFRASVLNGYPPKWMKQLAMGDWPLWVLCAKEGKLGYIDENMATYRIHAGGAWSGQSIIRQAQQTLQALTLFKKIYQIKTPTFEASFANWKRHLIELRLHREDYFHAANDAWCLVPYAVVHSMSTLAFAFKVMLRGYCPPVWLMLNRIKKSRRQQ